MELDDAPPPYEAVQLDVHTNNHVQSAPTTVATVVKLTQHGPGTSNLAHNSFGKVFRRVTTAITFPSNATYVELCESLHSRVMVHFGVDLDRLWRSSVCEATSLTIRLDDSGTGVLVADQDEWAAARGWVMGGSASLEFDFRSSMGRLPSGTAETIVGNAAQGVRQHKVERDERVRKAAPDMQARRAVERTEPQRCCSLTHAHWTPARAGREAMHANFASQQNSASTETLQLFTVICQRKPSGIDNDGAITMNKMDKTSVLTSREANFTLPMAANKAALMTVINSKIQDLFGVSMKPVPGERPGRQVAVEIVKGSSHKNEVRFTIYSESNWYAIRDNQTWLRLAIDFVVPEEHYPPAHSMASSGLIRIWTAIYQRRPTYMDENGTILLHQCYRIKAAWADFTLPQMATRSALVTAIDSQLEHHFGMTPGQRAGRQMLISLLQGYPYNNRKGLNIESEADWAAAKNRDNTFLDTTLGLSIDFAVPTKRYLARRSKSAEQSRCVVQ
ncbi:hypothetical protein LTR15_000259 [Elasticomyces elasticus]|nr:hypothetical protein LTR15_000259 [Elasticomyces elasticus]